MMLERVERQVDADFCGQFARPEAGGEHYMLCPDCAFRRFDFPSPRGARPQVQDRALALDPGHARAYASRGLLHHNTNAFEDALEDYGRSLELDPWAAGVYLNRGGTYATLGDLDAALQDYGRALVLQPDDADIYYNRGTVYAIQQR